MVEFVTKLIRIPNSAWYPEEIRCTLQHPTKLLFGSNVKVKVRCVDCKNVKEVMYWQVSKLDRYLCRRCFSFRLGRRTGRTGKQKGPIFILEESNILCDYCRVRVAKYYFPGVKKYCCEYHWTKCPLKRAKMHEYLIPWNKGKKNFLSKESLDKMKRSLTYTLSDYQEKYPLFCKVEELREDPETGVIQVRCHWNECRKWFTPGSDQFRNRIYALEKSDGNDASFYYCSDECKDKCPSYNLHGDPYDWYIASEYQIFKEEVIRRNIEEYGELTCEFCGNTKSRQLVVHHELPQKTHPESSLDPEVAWVLCGTNSKDNCHMKIGHPRGTWCSTGNLSKLICGTRRLITGESKQKVKEFSYEK